MKVYTIWTPEMLAQIERLWGQGYSLSSIATRLNEHREPSAPFISRNAVVGKLGRLRKKRGEGAIASRKTIRPHGARGTGPKQIRKIIAKEFSHIATKKLPAPPKPRPTRPPTSEEVKANRAAFRASYFARLAKLHKDGRPIDKAAERTIDHLKAVLKDIRDEEKREADEIDRANAREEAGLWKEEAKRLATREGAHV